MAATYVNLDQVRSHLPQFQITNSSRPSSQQVQEFIDDLQDRVDSVLGNLGYDVPFNPVTYPDAVRILRGIILDGATSKILVSALAGVRNPEEFGASGFWKRYENALKALANPDDPLILPGVEISLVAAKITPEFASHVTDVTVTDLEDLDKEPRISRTQLF